VPRVSFIRIEAGDVAQWYSTCLAMLEALDQIPSILGVGETVFQGKIKEIRAITTMFKFLQLSKEY
jgi:hypothetical protein